MSARVTYVLKHDIAQTVKEPNGDLREDVIRAAGSEIYVRRTKGKDITEIRKVADEVAQSYMMISRHTGLSVEDVGDMDVEDIAGVSEVLESFMPDGLKKDS